MRTRRRGLLQFIVLYTALYAAFGLVSPFLPIFLSERGFGPEQLGILLGLGTALRTISGPVTGHLADRFHAFKPQLSAAALLSGILTFMYVPAGGLWTLAAVSLLGAVTLAPLVPLADGLTLACARPADGRRGFEYGWVRGAGSAAFIAGVLGAGQIAAAHGLSAVIVSSAGCLAVTSLLVLSVPERPKPEAKAASDRTAHEWRTLFRPSSFLWVTLVAGLVLGSHAMHDSFAVIRWTAAGVSAGTSSLLWSESVAAEVVVFVLIGPTMLRAFGPAAALTIAALAGAVRWIVMAQTADVAALLSIEPLHGLSFALLHLACMRVIVDAVPAALAGTAQTVYGLLGVGGATALMTAFSGWLYGRFGAEGFWAMALLCVLALPVIWLLRMSLRARVHAAPEAPPALDRSPQRRTSFD
ncbi:MAG TPA: MFS transporter [Xanthobacteraceae bacterium]|jgi:PPP family 3-phenylpropionic acid transporter